MQNICAHFKHDVKFMNITSLSSLHLNKVIEIEVKTFVVTKADKSKGNFLFSLNFNFSCSSSSYSSPELKLDFTLTNPKAAEL